MTDNIRNNTEIILELFEKSKAQFLAARARYSEADASGYFYDVAHMIATCEYVDIYNVDIEGERPECAHHVANEIIDWLGGVGYFFMDDIMENISENLS